MKEVFVAIIGAGVFTFGIFFMINAVPDSFRCGGVFFDKYPIWMGIMFCVGMVAVAASLAFFVACLVHFLLECRQIRLWIKEWIQCHKDRNMYKFNNIREENLQ